MAILCDLHSLMPVGFFMSLSVNDLLPTCCNLMMFYDWSECVMSALGTAKHSSRARAVVLTLDNKVVLYCIPVWNKCLNVSALLFQFQYCVYVLL